MGPEGRNADHPTAAAIGSSVGGFRLLELSDSCRDGQIYSARDEQVGRHVVVRVAGLTTADALLDVSKKMAAVSHPGVMPVLAAGRTESGAYAAIQLAEALPLSEAGPLSSAQVARVMMDVLGAIDALAEVGLRIAITTETVLVSVTADGVRGVVDPLRDVTFDPPFHRAVDTASSTRELAALVERELSAPSSELAAVLANVRDGRSSDPRAAARDLDRFIAPMPGSPPRRRPLAITGCIATLVLAGAVAMIVHGESGGGSAAAAARDRPAARVAARIPFGLPSNEWATSVALLDRSAWITTNRGRLLKVDTKTNEVVGTPVSLGKYTLFDLTASRGSLYALDYAGWILRIDPLLGRVTGRRRLSSHPDSMRPAHGILWVASEEGSKGFVTRFKLDTLQPIGRPLPGPPHPWHIDVRGSRIWVEGGARSDEIDQIDTASGSRRVAYDGLQPFNATIAGSTLWIADLADGTVSALDDETMAYNRPALLTPRSAERVSVWGGDVWVVVTSEPYQSGAVQLERFDTRSGRRAGTPAAIGKDGYLQGAMQIGLGSLWIATDTTLWRVVPTTPRPPLEALPRSSGSFHPLIPGPLEAGHWRTNRFDAPFTFSTPAYLWQAVYPEPDTAAFLTTRDPHAELDIGTPRQMFAADGADARSVGSPTQLLALLRRDPHLRVGPVHRKSIGGRAALQFELRPYLPARHTTVCGTSPCVLLFPVQDYTGSLDAGEVVRASLLRSDNRTVVIFQHGDGNSQAALSLTTSLLGTVRFAR